MCSVLALIQVLCLVLVFVFLKLIFITSHVFVLYMHVWVHEPWLVEVRGRLEGVRSSFHHVGSFQGLNSGCQAWQCACSEPAPSPQLTFKIWFVFKSAHILPHGIFFTWNFLEDSWSKPSENCFGSGSRSIILATGEVEAGRSGVQGHPQLHSELKASLGYVRLSLK